MAVGEGRGGADRFIVIEVAILKIWRLQGIFPKKERSGVKGVSSIVVFEITKAIKYISYPLIDFEV